MRTIGVVTVGRSDYGLYVPILRRISEDPELRLHLIVAGMHLSADFGLTVRAIEADGFAIGDRVEMLLASDTPQAIAKSMGLGVIGFAESYTRLRPDILLVLGDRFEMHAAVLAALPFTLPVAHIHGGELTEGAFDDALRHSITKLSHLHFVAADEYARRIIQMGEEPWRVVVSGSPALDDLGARARLGRQELERRFAVSLDRPPLLVTFHPVTLEHDDTESQVVELLAALDATDLPLVFTQPNADTHGRLIARMIADYAARRPRTWMVHNLGREGYASMMVCAAAMVGNSSSGLVEAPSLEVPVVNVGTRQQGRIRARNVIDAGHGREEIIAGIRQATTPEFRASLAGLVNPYGNGRAAEVIVGRLKEIGLDRRLITKRFADAPAALREARYAGVD